MPLWLLLLMIPLWLPARPSHAPSKKVVPAHREEPTGGGPTTNPTLVTIDPVKFSMSPGYRLYKTNIHCDSKVVPVAFGVYLPRAFYESHDPLPVVVPLHTRGASGADGRHRYIDEELALLTVTTRQDFRTEGEYTKVRLDLHTQGKFICLMPQCPDGYKWETPPVGRMLEAEINLVVKKYQADADRVYLTGFSYGASSTWRVALQVPHLFAAIAPIDARQTPHPDEDVKVLSHLPIYLAVGQNDTDFVRECNNMDAAMKKIAHADYVYRFVPKGNHFCYPCIYEDPAFWDWMFAHHRPHPAVASAATRPSYPDHIR